MPEASYSTIKQRREVFLVDFFRKITIFDKSKKMKLFAALIFAATAQDDPAYEAQESYTSWNG